jgi:Ca2+-binding EF-hand superfamily protein
MIHLDLRKKLEYTFHLYDTDGNGILDMEEVKTVLTAMLDLIGKITSYTIFLTDESFFVLLGAEKKEQNIQQLTEECMTQLDKSKNGKITKSNIKIIFLYFGSN